MALAMSTSKPRIVAAVRTEELGGGVRGVRADGDRALGLDRVRDHGGQGRVGGHETALAPEDPPGGGHLRTRPRSPEDAAAPGDEPGRSPASSGDGGGRSGGSGHGPGTTDSLLQRWLDAHDLALPGCAGGNDHGSIRSWHAGRAAPAQRSAARGGGRGRGSGGARRSRDAVLVADGGRSGAGAGPVDPAPGRWPTTVRPTWPATRRSSGPGSVLVGAGVVGSVVGSRVAVLRACRCRRRCRARPGVGPAGRHDLRRPAAGRRARAAPTSSQPTGQDARSRSAPGPGGTAPSQPPARPRRRRRHPRRAGNPGRGLLRGGGRGGGRRPLLRRAWHRCASRTPGAPAAGRPRRRRTVGGRR